MSKRNYIAAAARGGVIAWIYGHHHASQFMDLQGIRLLSAQPGYPGEVTGWSGPGIVEVN